MERRLAAILAADVVGYSRLMEADEDGTLAALKSHRAEFIDPAIASRGGRIVKLMGDGALAEFPSVVDAVEFAVAMQKGMAERNTDVPEGQRIVFRIGVNLGDVIIEGEDIYGDGVNVAARLETLAEPGGVCISGTVREHIAGKVDHDFADDGDQTVKNMSRPVRVWRWSEGATAQARTPDKRVPPSPPPDKPAIAVLPFTNMSGQPEEEYFADGISEDIITELSRFHEFAVIARNSSFQYKGQSPNIEDVARNLGVRYVIEGSVRRAGERVRVTAQLIDANGGSHIWADRYDRDLTDIFAIQDEVTEAVVARVADSVKGAGATQSRSRPTDSITAYDLVLQSRPYRTAIKRSSNEQARRLLQRAIAIDPDYALAYASLAFVLVGDYDEGWTTDPEETLRDALAAARKAVSLDDSDGYSHASLAYVHQAQGNFDSALNEVKIALSLNPNNVNIVMTAGWISIVAGDPDSGIAYIQRARRLNPYMGGFELWTLGLGYLDARRYDDAVEVFQQVSDPPTNLYLNLAICYAYLDRPQKARAALGTFLDHAKKEMTFFPGDDPRAWRAFLERAVVRHRKETFEHTVEGARRAGLPVA